MKKDLRKLLAQFAGATARKTGGNHWRIALPCGAIVIASNTPSDRRALQKIRADLRRAGGARHGQRSRNRSGRGGSHSPAKTTTYAISEAFGPKGEDQKGSDCMEVQMLAEIGHF